MREKTNQSEKWICCSLLAVFVFLVNYIYFNSVYPVSETWGIYYVGLLDRGQVPYVDFYYYLPPLNLLTDWIFWKLSFGYLLAFRGWYLLERIVTMVLLYFLLCRYFRPRYVWIACITATCLGASCVYDLCGDYNQTEMLLIVGLMYFIALFLERSDDADCEGLKRYRYFFGAGAVLGLMLMLKQSTALAAILVCLAFLAVYCLSYRDRRWFWYALATLAGILVPVLLCMIYLLIGGALPAFFSTYLGAAGAKGGTGTILVSFFYQLLAYDFRRYLVVYLVLLLSGCLLMRVSVHGRSGVLMTVLSLVLLAAVIDAYYHAHWMDLFHVIGDSRILLILIIGGFLFIAVYLWGCRHDRLHLLRSWNNLLPTLILLLGSFFFVMTNFRTIPFNFFSGTYAFDDITTLLTYAAIYGLLTALGYGFLTLWRQKRLPYPKAYLFLLCGGVIASYAGSMASGIEGMTERAMFITTAVLFVLLFSLRVPTRSAASHRTVNHFKNLLLTLFCVLVCSLCMTQKYVAPYTWWGTGAEPRYDRTETVDLKPFAGIRLSENSKIMYEEVTRLILENSGPSDSVWGFPHVKIFNVLTDRYDVNDPVPVPFYDVCSDEAAVREARWLERHEPSIVVWCDIPNCMEVHESVFRGGEPLGQREIQRWFAAVKDTDYDLIGQAGNLFVYKLRDGSDIRYTYFQNPGLENQTAVLPS